MPFRRIYSSSSSSSSSSSIVVCAIPSTYESSQSNTRKQQPNAPLHFLVLLTALSLSLVRLSKPPTSSPPPHPHKQPEGDTKNLRSKSRRPLCVILLPPLSSSCSKTPIFSSACMTLRSTLPLASTWWLGREPRFLVEPCTLRRRPTPTVLRR